MKIAKGVGQVAKQRRMRAYIDEFSAWAGPIEVLSLKGLCSFSLSRWTGVGRGEKWNRGCWDTLH